MKYASDINISHDFICTFGVHSMYETILNILFWADVCCRMFDAFETEKKQQHLK